MVRPLVYFAEERGSGPTWNRWLEARPLSTQQQMGTRWKHWGDKSGEERNWSQYRWPGKIVVLSNRHFPPTYGSYMGLTHTFNHISGPLLCKTAYLSQSIYGI